MGIARTQRFSEAALVVALLTLAVFAWLEGGAGRVLAGVHTWVDEQGVMHFSDKAKKPARPEPATGEKPAAGQESSQPTVTAKPLPPGDGPVFMWKISSPENHVYLLGSMHLAKEELYPLDPRIEAAFEQSDVLAVESDVEAREADIQAVVLELGMYPPDDSLDKHISQKTMELLQEQGLWTPMLLRMKPWLLALQLQNQRYMQLGYQQSLGLDRHFLLKARNQGKSVKELEDMVKVMQVLASASEGREDQYLYYSLLELDRLEEIITRINNAWQDGDVAAMSDVIFEEINRHPEFKEFGRLLFDERNKKMAAEVEDYLQSGKPHFVVVGAGHLVGANSMPRLLEKMGYVVWQVGAQ